MSATIRVDVRSPKEKKDVFIAENCTVEELRNAVAKEFDAEPSQLSLIYAGKILRDGDTVYKCGIRADSIVHLVIRTLRPPAASVPEAAMAQSADGGMSSLPGMLSSLGMGSTPLGLGDMGGLAGLSGLSMGATNVNDFQQKMMQEMFSNPEMMRSMMSSPFVQQMMSNPDFMRQIMSMNPMWKDMVEKKPEIMQMFSSPELMQQMGSVFSNPAMLQSVMQGGGEGLVSQFMQNPQMMSSLMQNSFGQAAQGSDQSQLLQEMTKNREKMSEAMRMLMQPADANSSEPISTGSQATQATPSRHGDRQQSIPPRVFENVAEQMNNPQMQELLNNPQVRDALLHIRLGNQNQRPNQSRAEPVAQNPSNDDVENLQQLYASQLQQLSGMGFTDTDANIQALAATHGDVPSAVDQLIQMH